MAALAWQGAGQEAATSSATRRGICASGRRATLSAGRRSDHGGLADTKRREGTRALEAVPGRRGGTQGWDARRRVWERAPGDAGVRLASPERMHSSDDCAAAGFAAAFAAQPAESQATNGTRAEQFRNLLADTGGGGRVATVHCTGTQVALRRGQAVRWAPQIITTARRTRSAAMAPTAR